MRLQDTEHQFDVAILGTGLSGSMLACVLAMKVVSVVLIDAGTHPRFAVGESTIPHTSLLTLVMAQKYGVPELENIAYPDRIAERVCTTCGIKRAFGFAYHRPGQVYDSREGHQVGTSSKDENHFFRQDIDAYLFHVAVRYGAIPRQKTKVTSVEIDRDGVTIQTGAGEDILARSVVDGTGHESMLAARFNLRENPCPLKHHSQTIFTHMIDVPPFQEEHNLLSVSWDQGTLHHCFERGWFWVIPFNNHARSTNPLVSVGVTVDPRRYPKSNASPEEEWSNFDLWNAWLRAWALGTVNTEYRAMTAVADFTATGDDLFLKGEAADPVFSDFEDPDYHAFFDRVVPLIEGVV